MSSPAQPPKKKRVRKPKPRPPGYKKPIKIKDHAYKGKPRAPLPEPLPGDTLRRLVAVFRAHDKDTVDWAFDNCHRMYEDLSKPIAQIHEESDEYKERGRRERNDDWP